MKHALEGSKMFPYLAWIGIIVLAVFTYYLVLELKKSAEYLGDKTQENVTAIEEGV